MFYKAPYRTTLCTLAVATGLMTSAGCGRDAQKSEPRDVLSNTTWSDCNFDLSKKDAEGETVVYSQTSLHFRPDGSFLMTRDHYASDSECKKIMANADVAKLTDEEPAPKTYFTGTYQAKALSSGTGLYAFDLHLSSGETPNLYLTLLIQGETLKVSARCFNEDYIKEGLCKKVDGLSPETRANYLDDPNFKDETWTYHRVQAAPAPQALEAGRLNLAP